VRAPIYSEPEDRKGQWAKHPGGTTLLLQYFMVCDGPFFFSSTPSNYLDNTCLTTMSSTTRLDVRRRNNKRLRCTVQPFPAVSAREHEEVGKALLSVVRGGGGGAANDEPTENDRMGVVMPIEAALERVAVWRCRIPRLFHAVESTAALAQILHRMDDRNRQSSCTTMELRLSLSCAILRTINGLADTLQQQRSTACSVAMLCQELGVPSWLVDIRHEATHNQLPPLPTLRLAAVSLLQYFASVYWDPLAQSRVDAYTEAMDILRAYESVSMESGTKVDEDKNQQVESMSDSEEDEKDIAAIERSMLPIPGTNANRFSLLLDDGRSKKKSATESPKKKAKSSSADTNKKQPQQSTRSSCAHKFVKAKIPIDIKYQAALDFLLSGDNGGGVLLVANDSVDDCINQYGLLLATIGRVWPGFLHALVIQCVNLFLSMGKDTDDSKAGSVVSWVRYVLSRSFLGQLDSSINSSKKATSGLAPLKTLKVFQFPLNSLCDRCMAAAEKNVGAAALGMLFAEILGNERCADHGVDLTAFSQSQKQPLFDDVKAQAKNSAGHVATFPRTDSTTASMSLAAMEAFLADGVGATGSASVPNCDGSHNNAQKPTLKPSTTTTTWVRCTSWEPCAIGTLPGFFN